MIDDKTRKAPQDAARVNVNERHEVRYWTKRFGCTEEQLRSAVSKVGVSAKAVEAELKER